MTKAVGIARQSRGDEASKSVEAQVERIREHCKRENLTLIGVHEERDVSGGRPLAKRPGLLQAVEAVERGAASVIVVAYFDRLVRSLSVQLEVVQRVEAAGGRIVAVDFGDVSHATATGELTAGFLGQVAQYHRSATRERVAAAHEALISEGKWCGGRAVPFGYRKGEDGRLVEVPADADALRKAFRMRKDGKTFEDIRAMLRERTGLEWKSLSQVQRMMSNEVYLGVLRHGKLENCAAHQAIVEPSLFRGVGDVHSKRGPRPVSTRLLARLGVLRCATCGSKMVVHGARSQIQTYRCGGQACERKAAISCHIAEAFVEDVARATIYEQQGSAGADVEAVSARLEEKRRRMEAVAMRLQSSSVGKLDVVVAQLEVLQAEVDQLEDELARAREAAGFTLTGTEAWKSMDDETKRRVIRAVITKVQVKPGRVERKISAELSRESLTAAEPVLDEVAALRVA